MHPDNAPVAKPPFPQRAAKLSLLLPLVLVLWTTASRTLAPHFPIISTPIWPVVSALLCLVVSLAGISLAVVAFCGIARFGRAKILARAIFGTAINGLFLFILVSNFIAGRQQARAQSSNWTKVEQEFKELRNDLNSDTETDSSAKLEKIRAQVEATAEKMTGADAAIMRANSAYLKAMQLASGRYETASNAFETDDILDLETSKAPEQLASKRIVIQEFIDANDNLVSVLSGVEELFHSELKKANIPQRDLDQAMTGLREGFRKPLSLQLRIRKTDHDFGTTLLDIINLLEGNLGKWDHDETEDELVTEDEILRTKYQQLLEKLEEIAIEQAEAQELLQEMRSSR